MVLNKELTNAVSELALEESAGVEGSETVAVLFSRDVSMPEVSPVVLALELGGTGETVDEVSAGVESPLNRDVSIPELSAVAVVSVVGFISWSRISELLLVFEAALLPAP